MISMESKIRSLIKTIMYSLISTLTVLIGCNKQLTPLWLGDEAINLPNGIEYIYLKHGAGPEVMPGMRVSTLVILKVGDSTEVWNTRKDGELFVFRFKKDNMIDGFDKIIGMSRTGDRIKAIIPPYLGYGSEGAGDQIPGNAYLSFDIEVVNAEK